MDKEIPEDPFAFPVEAAGSMYEWFKGLVKGGFTADEAMTLISKVIAEMLRASPELGK